MDSIQQQSIIPKKSVIEDHSKAPTHMSFATFVVMLIFIVSLILAGGSWFLANKEKKSLDQKIASINSTIANFNENEIDEIKDLNKITDSSDKLLESHYMVSPILKILQVTALKTVKYTKFSGASYDSKLKTVEVKMSGSAGTYTEIAQQGDAIINCNVQTNPIFSNLALDEKGRVSFDMQFSVPFELISFDKNYQNLGNTNFPCSNN